MTDSTVKVWSIAPTTAAEQRSIRWLTLDECDWTLRFARARDRRSFVVTRAALRRVLARELGVGATDLALRRSDRGKLEIARLLLPCYPEFSVSHADGLGLIALARKGAIGIDVERIRPLDDIEAIAAKAFGYAVAERLSRLLEPARGLAFFRCWTAGEAFAKATGVGIAELGTFPIELSDNLVACFDGTTGPGWGITPLDVDARYAATLVCQADGGEFPHIQMLVDDLVA
jgi:4'-phosphopantetheinyl transferase